MDYFAIKWLHIVSSTLLFGTGVGSAYYMFVASRSRDPHVIAFVAKYVVIADWLITAPTVLIQPLSGWYLAARTQLPWNTGWLRDAVWFYAFAIACWLPVVWIQIRMRDLARLASSSGTDMPERYWRFFAAWVVLGAWAFVAFVVVFYLMVVKP